MYHYTNTNNPIDFPKPIMPKPNSARMMFLIEYDSSHWAGASSNVVVWAETEDEALYLAESHMEDEMREMYMSEYDESTSDGSDYSDECSYNVISVEPFGPLHEQWEFFQDETQAEFYPVVGKP